MPEVSQVGSVGGRVCVWYAGPWLEGAAATFSTGDNWRPEQQRPAFLFSSTWWSIKERIGRPCGTLTAAPSVPSLKLFSLSHFVTGHSMPWVLWVVSGVGERNFVLFSSLRWAVLDRSVAYPTYGSRDSLRTLHKGGDGVQSWGTLVTWLAGLRGFSSSDWSDQSSSFFLVLL